jgi:UrcA family protein
MHLSIPSLAAAVMLSTLAVRAHADTSSADPVIRGRSIVHYADLNIAAEQDAKILLQRIGQAAKEACGDHPTFKTYTAMPDHSFEECLSGTIARTVKKLSAPVVTRLYAEEIREARSVDVRNLR